MELIIIRLGSRSCMSVNITPIHTSGSHTYVFFDPSASHLSYCVVQVDLDTKEAVIKACGMLWTRSKWNRGQRFAYMQKALTALINAFGLNIDGCITEAFFANPKLLFGSSVIPTVNAFIEIAASERNIGYLEIGPPSWRSVLNIKPTKDAKGKRDFKTPTKSYVEAVIGKLPEKIASNIDLKERNTPTDVPDCLAICLAYSKHVGITNITLSSNVYYPIDYLNQFGIISNTI